MDRQAMKPIPETAFSPAAYGEVIAALLCPPRLMSLDAGKPNEKVLRQLETLSVSAAFAPHVIVDEDMARACLAGLWLYHDFLDQLVRDRHHLRPGAKFVRTREQRHPEFWRI